MTAQPQDSAEGNLYQSIGWKIAMENSFQDGPRRLVMLSDMARAINAALAAARPAADAVAAPQDDGEAVRKAAEHWIECAGNAQELGGQFWPNMEKNAKADFTTALSAHTARVRREAFEAACRLMCQRCHNGEPHPISECEASRIRATAMKENR